MKIRKNLVKKVLALGLAGSILTGCIFKNQFIGGKKYVNIMENGEHKKIEIPVYPLWKVGPNNCALYSRLVTEKLGNKINKGCAWNLPKLNKASDYNSVEISKGDLVLFYNPKSPYNNGERKGTHVACYLGKNEKGEKLFAEERGYKTKITAMNEFKEKGFVPVKNIYVERD